MPEKARDQLFGLHKWVHLEVNYPQLCRLLIFDWSFLEREQGIGNREECWEMGRWGDGDKEEVVFNNLV